jgi:hypothetical protein
LSTIAHDWLDIGRRFGRDWGERQSHDDLGDALRGEPDLPAAARRELDDYLENAYGHNADALDEEQHRLLETGFWDGLRLAAGPH